MVRRTIALTFDAILLTHGADGKLVIGGYTLGGNSFDAPIVAVMTAASFSASPLSTLATWW